MLIGSHVSMSGKEMLLNSAKEAASYKANVMMIYTGPSKHKKKTNRRVKCRSWETVHERTWH